MLTTLEQADEVALAGIAEEKAVRQTTELFLLFSMGSQFDHLIAQALGRLGVFCLVADPAKVTLEDIENVAPTGIIISGGPASVHAEPPPFDDRIFDAGIPILGICLGAQMIANHLGLTVASAEKREFGRHPFARTDSDDPLFAGLPRTLMVLESHGDTIAAGTDQVEILGWTPNAPVAALRSDNLRGVQFHPEVTDTDFGEQMLANFCFNCCGAKDRYPAEDAAARKIAELKEQIGDRQVLLALSGGSDSSTVAYLLGHAVGFKPGQIRAVYIRGIDRPDDEAYVRKFFGDLPWLELCFIDATADFLEAFRGQETMKAKRVAMRGVYKHHLEAEAERFGASFIAQGTLYTDISESGGGYNSGARKARIKLHHNFDLGFKLTELTPLADCVKDSGRNIGRAIGVPEELLQRHPFPGPGLVVRIEGEVTEAKLAIARKADEIFIDELRRWDLYGSVWQAGAVVTSSITTCTKGDDAGAGIVIALWAVWSVNGFTANWARLSYDFLDAVSQRLTNEIREVGAVVYRISGKPPATIEWG